MMGRPGKEYQWPERGITVTVNGLHKMWGRRVDTIKEWIRYCDGDIERVNNLNNARIDAIADGKRRKEKVLENGKTYNQISDELGCKSNVLRCAVHRYGLEKGIARINELQAVKKPIIVKAPRPQDTDENIKPTYKPHVCTCPKCAKRHTKKMWWTGTGTPRKYCELCSGEASRNSESRVRCYI